MDFSWYCRCAGGLQGPHLERAVSSNRYPNNKSLWWLLWLLDALQAYHSRMQGLEVQIQRPPGGLKAFFGDLPTRSLAYNRRRGNGI